MIRGGRCPGYHTVIRFFGIIQRVSANFLDWVVREHDKDLVRNLNTAAREGRYSGELWKELTGKSVDELGVAWKAAHAERLASE